MVQRRKKDISNETSCFVPVPKKRSHPSALNNYGPVTITSHMNVLLRLLSAHLIIQAPFKTHYSLLIILGLVLKMPSSTCFGEPTFIWTKHTAPWGSCSLISPMLLIYFSLYCYVRSFKKNRGSENLQKKQITSQTLQASLSILNVKVHDNTIKTLSTHGFFGVVVRRKTLLS